MTHLLAELDVLRLRGDPDPVRIRGVACHSADVVPGSVFVCIRGVEDDGHRFIADAVRRGAVSLVVDGAFSPRPDQGGRSSAHLPRIPVIHVDDTRRAYALLSAALAGHPARGLHVTGITGTNGKTSTAFFLDSIHRATGFRTGLVTTVFSRVGDKTWPQKLTTPEAGALQSLLSRMRAAAVERVIIETSSHALQMQRLAGTVLQTAVFTNLARDHLDYHGDWSTYRRAKARIFSLLDLRQGVAVLNVDDAAGRYYVRSWSALDQCDPPNGAAPPRVVTFGIRHPADVRGTLLPPEAPIGAPVHLRITTPSGTMITALPGPGLTHAYNALAAAAAAWAQDIPPSTIAQGLATANLPPGRSQEIRAGQPFRVFIDFAHNPAGLAHALQAIRHELRSGTRGRVHLVFGCKGDDGDEFKRRLMGRVAARYANEITVTTDNPCNECPQHIAGIVAQGVKDAGFPDHSLSIVLDRAAAIHTALLRAHPGDAVLIAGRGHEQEQRFGPDTVPLDDAAVAAQCLQDQYHPLLI